MTDAWHARHATVAVSCAAAGRRRFSRSSEGADAMNMGTSWAEVAAALAVMGIIVFLLLT